MALTYVQYPGDNSTKTFSFNFPYLERAHVNVKLNGVPMTRPGDWDWSNDSTIEMKLTPTIDEVVEIYRETPYTTNLVEFQNGAVLTEDELNTAVRQLLYIFQEYNERVRQLIEDSATKIATGEGLQVADGESVFDQIVAEMLDTNLEDTIQARIADIEANGELTIKQDLDLLDSKERWSKLGVESDDGKSFIFDLDWMGISDSETFAQRLSTIQSQYEDNSAAISSEAVTRANADSAFSNTISLIGAETDGGTTFTLDETTVLVEDDAGTGTIGIGSKFSGLLSKVGDNEAAITTEQNTRASQDQAIADELHLIGAKDANGTAFIIDESTAMVESGSLSLASKFTNIESSIGDNEASITTNASSIQGIEVRYGVRLDSNGYVSGFQQLNDGETSSFKIRADEFLIVDPAGGSGQGGNQVFSVSGGVVQAQNLKVQFADIEDVSIGNAEIENLAVGTSNLQYNAASIANRSHTVGSVNPANAPSGWTTIQSLNYSSVGFPVGIWFSFFLYSSGAGAVFVDYRIVRNGTVLIEGTKNAVASGNAVFTMWFDSPQPGTITYELQVADRGNGGVFEARVSDRAAYTLESKR